MDMSPAVAMHTLTQVFKSLRRIGNDIISINDSESVTYRENV